MNYLYNAQNLLTALSTMRWNTWDAEQRRLGLNLGMGGTAFTFVYDPTASIPAVIQEFSSGGRNMVYVREPDGSLVAQFTPGESPTVDHYYFDGLGSTVMMTEGLSTVTDRYDYTPWGEVTHLSGTTADNPYQYVGQLGYYNHWMDSSLSDLLHLGVRFYEPGVGRFSQKDSVSAEGFRYAMAQPLTMVDFDGRRALPASALPTPKVPWYLKWFCKLFPKNGACTHVVKPVQNYVKCAQAFNCTLCASDLMEAARECKDLEGHMEEILGKPYYGNSDRWQIDCTNRVARAHGNDANVVDCITKCAKIPIEMLGGTSPKRL